MKFPDVYLDENIERGVFIMDIASFIIYCFIVTFTPGPTNIVILSTVHNYGSKKQSNIHMEQQLLLVYYLVYLLC